MNDFNPDDLPDADAWLIPLHGISVPSADTGPTPTPTPIPSADIGPAFLPFSDDPPADIGFHPRLRRSA